MIQCQKYLRPESRLSSPKLDLLWKAGYVLMMLQLVTATVPWFAYGRREWEVCLVTVCGTAIAVFQ
jgi:hypothetical protein